MRLYVRYIDDQPNGIVCCKLFKAYEGNNVQIQVDDDKFDSFPELVIELDSGEVIRNVLDFEAL